MAWAVDQENCTASEKLVLIVLAKHANPTTGQCNPSIERIAMICSLSTRQVIRCIDSLEKRKLIYVSRSSANGKKLSNSYVIYTEKVIHSSDTMSHLVVTHSQFSSDTMSHAVVTPCHIKRYSEKVIEKEDKFSGMPVEFKNWANSFKKKG